MMKDRICMVIVLICAIAITLFFGHMSIFLFRGYFITGEVAGVASSVNDLIGCISCVVVACCGVQLARHTWYLW